MCQVIHWPVTTRCSNLQHSSLNILRIYTVECGGGGGGIPQSVQRHRTDWTVGDSKSVSEKRLYIFHIRPERPWGTKTSSAMDNGALSQGEAVGLCVDHSMPSTAWLQTSRTTGLFTPTLCAKSWRVTGWLSHFTCTYIIIIIIMFLKG